jgi:hypothetical protein
MMDPGIQFQLSSEHPEPEELRARGVNE